MAFGGDKFRRSQTQNKMKHLNYGRIGLNPETLCVIKLPDSLVLRIISRSLFLAVVIITLPCIRTIFRAGTASVFHPGSDLIPSDQLDLFLRDFLDQGLLKTGQKALILNPGVEGLFQDLKRLDSIEFELVATSDFEQRRSLVENSYDFIFMSISVDPNLVDLAVKVDGIVAVPLSNNPSSASPLPFLSNYRIVYLRNYSSMIMGMKKTSQANNHYSASSRRLCQIPLEAKRRALKGLEDVLLEPPRTSLEKPKKIKYLPDLTGDSLRDYRQRIFIGVGLPEETKAMVEWFEENYPKQGQKFEVFTMDATAKREEEVSHGNENDVCDWLTKNAKESEYVVMKAEAEVVEKMMKKRAIRLVDELFLECRNQWWGEKKGKRAYWECVALYGKLRDEGVAVHQWWN